ncbi:hypothetical protein GCM10011379_45580 [Filimonas zeae]|uniref:Uncharacterized protein n=1 Tax=Filimonas zeae TaxID=1737353 RepID=A0A917J3M5_9BACT|nr:hypothetical protein GCM10011379_45580 [Filimonas zeae]
MFGFLETLVEYYTGRDASLLSDEALVLKVAHIKTIRKMEAENSLNNSLETFLK